MLVKNISVRLSLESLQCSASMRSTLLRAGLTMSTQFRKALPTVQGVGRCDASGCSSARGTRSGCEELHMTYTV